MSSPKVMSVSVDGAVARLEYAARATVLAGALPTHSAKRLMDLTRAVRLYLAAWDYSLAKGTLTALDDLLKGTTAEDANLDAIQAIRAHVHQVRTRLGQEQP